MSSRVADSVLPPLELATPANPRDRLAEEVTALYDEFRSPLLRYLSGFGLAMPDAEEVLQEVFLSLFQHLERGRPRHSIRGWLFRVAHNLALKRRMRTRRDSESRGDAGAVDLAADPHPNPEEGLSAGQTRQGLLSVVEALPEQDRRCLFLRAEGLRYREIAGILNMSLGAISLSLSRSLARLSRHAQRSGI